VILKTFLELRKLLVASLFGGRELLAQVDLCGFLVSGLVLSARVDLLEVALDLVEDLLSLVKAALFSSSLSLTELVFGSILLLRDVLAALDNSIVVVADLLEVLLAHGLASLLSGGHSLSELNLHFETLCLLKTLSSSLRKCNSVLGGKPHLLQFLALGGGLLEFLVDLLQRHGFLGDEEAVLQVRREFFALGVLNLDFESGVAHCQLYGDLCF